MKQLNMQNDENDVIRYLMKEMDPSEEVLMERAMMEDDDLLIEVESMRQTLGRLDDLPEKAPPEELSKSIIKQAGEQKSKTTSYWPSVPSEMLKYAAVLLVGMGIGSGIWMYAGSSSRTSAIYPVSASQQARSDTRPWTDRNNVLYYQDEFSGQPSANNGILQTSMEKLTPVDVQSLRMNPNTRGVQLTGAHK